MLARKAPEEVKQLERELNALSSSIQLLIEEAENPTSILTTSGQGRVDIVKEMMSGTRDILEELEKYAKKHGLLAKDDAHRSRWHITRDKLKFAKDAGSVSGLRNKISYQNGIMQLLLTSIGNSSLERLHSENNAIKRNQELTLDLLQAIRQGAAPDFAIPLLSSVDLESQRLDISEAFLSKAELRGPWRETGISIWLADATRLLAASRYQQAKARLLRAHPIPNSDNPDKADLQGVVDLLKASWLVVDVVGNHPQRSFITSRQRLLLITRLADDVAMELTGVQQSGQLRARLSQILSEADHSLFCEVPAQLISMKEPPGSFNIPPSDEPRHRVVRSQCLVTLITLDGNREPRHEAKHFLTEALLSFEEVVRERRFEFVLSYPFGLCHRYTALTKALNGPSLTQTSRVDSLVSPVIRKIAMLGEQPQRGRRDEGRQFYGCLTFCSKPQQYHSEQSTIFGTSYGTLKELARWEVVLKFSCMCDLYNLQHEVCCVYFEQLIESLAGLLLTSGGDGSMTALKDAWNHCSRHKGIQSFENVFYTIFISFAKYWDSLRSSDPSESEGNGPVLSTVYERFGKWSTALLALIQILDVFHDTEVRLRLTVRLGLLFRDVQYFPCPHLVSFALNYKAPLKSKSGIVAIAKALILPPTTEEMGDALLRLIWYQQNWPTGFRYGVASSCTRVPASTLSAQFRKALYTVLSGCNEYWNECYKKGLAANHPKEEYGFDPHVRWTPNYASWGLLLRGRIQARLRLGTLLRSSGECGETLYLKSSLLLLNMPEKTRHLVAYGTNSLGVSHWSSLSIPPYVRTYIREYDHTQEPIEDAALHLCYDPWSGKKCELVDLISNECGVLSWRCPPPRARRNKRDSEEWDFEDSGSEDLDSEDSGSKD